MGKAIIKFNTEMMEKGIDVSLISDILDKLPDGTKLCGVFNPYFAADVDYFSLKFSSELFKEVNECQIYPEIIVTFTEHKNMDGDNVYVESVDMSAALKAYDVVKIDTTNKQINLTLPPFGDFNYKETNYILDKSYQDLVLYGVGWDIGNMSSTGYTYIPTATGTMAYPPNTQGPSNTVTITEVTPGMYTFNYNGLYYTAPFKEILEHANNLNITYKFNYLPNEKQFTVSQINKECECGAHKTGSNMHSKWCCLFSE